MVAKQLGEAEKMALIPGIDFVDEPAGRRARIVGTGLGVWEIIKAYHEFDNDRDVLIYGMDWLTPEQIDVALRYYAAFPDEIDDWVKRDWANVP